MPRSVAVTPDNTRAYVTLRGAASIAVVDALTLEQIDVGARLDRIAATEPPTVEVSAQGGVALDSLLRFASLSKPTKIYGTVKGGGNAGWTLEIARFGTQDYNILAHGGADVSSAVLTVFNPADLSI